MRWLEIGDIILRKEEFSDAGKAQVLIEASDADGGRRDFLYEKFLPEFITALSGIFREEGIPESPHQEIVILQKFRIDTGDRHLAKVSFPLLLRQHEAGNG